VQVNVVKDFAEAEAALARLLDGQTEQQAANVAAEAYVQDILDWIAAGEAFTPRNGGAGLEGAISWKPAGGGSSMIYANKDYAGYVEQGTGIPAGHEPWVIEPKPGRTALKISGGPGGYSIRRKVVHPGSKPKPYFFADLATRQAHMEQAVIQLILRKFAGA